MGAGCCRARLPGAGGPGMPQPRGLYAVPDFGIANLRPGDKFHFNREPFIRQHLVVPEKLFSPHAGVHNPSFTLDSGMPVRPAVPPPPAGAAPVPPPRKKRRPPQPPLRCRAGSRQRGEDQDPPLTDSILSPVHTMELLKRMAQVEAQLGRCLASRSVQSFQRARSMDSLETLDRKGSSASFPGHRTPPASFEEPHLSRHGPRSLDLSRADQQVERPAAFTLQSWTERGQQRGSGGSSTALSNSTLLLSPRQWRPLSPSSPAAGAAGASSPPLDEPALSLHQTATRRAMSDFIVDSYVAEPPAPPHPPPRSPHSSASSTTESLEELEDDILHMLSSSPAPTVTPS